ncbi:cytochrome C biogenesis protein [Pandoraea thiooxydans]|uniref:Cytochrome C biogenesis protein n=1 Tax=Pandoraea thiooxydans TaxID=445709 RepID=A0A0G3EVP8_9BURK|nr:cytochrome c biogenesis protein DipZ [Pandoraea thiooxydans]AKJ68831.1 cytochrome C biogenesis protein [Pandoraea thiooxydans]APR96310.1 cytochrome C biogenesis protein [Pandoraea thiooxydans]
MLLIVLAYLGGVLTILSPCILPVLPFVFSRADQPFARSGLPLLAGMVLTFAAVATLAAVGGGWVVAANQYGRWLALIMLGLFGMTLLVPRLAEHLTRPLVALGNRLSSAANASGQPGAKSSFLLGIATGLLWAPCAGPILGLVLTGAALHGASVGTTLLLLAYAAGAATSLAVALLLGSKVFAAMKRSLGAGEWIRRGLGAAMLGGVAAIALGLDTGALASVSTVATSGLEQALIHELSPAATHLAGPARDGAMMAAQAQPDSSMRMVRTAASVTTASVALPVEGQLPPLSGAVQWLNSPPLTAQDLRGKVLLLDVWTYSCINCLRTLPYVKAWAKKYRDQGLVVIGVHAPEFAFERNVANVKRAVHELGIDYPVAIDNHYAIWRALHNEYWPAEYLVDAQGRIRHHHFGEGEYAQTEHAIQQLLAEAGHRNVATGLVGTPDKGVQMAPDNADLQSPETYIGYQRAERFASAGGQTRNLPQQYTAPARPALNQWGLAGTWQVGGAHATLDGATGRIVYRFHARDLNLVLGPAKDGKPVRFRVSIDGAPPGAAHGVDVDAKGDGTITEQRLYQLVRQDKTVTDRTFAIEFLDPGVQAYAFTFG